jgi:hypothetical protein
VDQLGYLKVCRWLNTLLDSVFLKDTVHLCLSLHIFPLLHASGVVSTTNNGGFTSIRTKVIIRILS